MQRKKLKKTNEFNKNNLWTRMLLCFLVSLTLIGLGALLAPTAVAQPPSPRGFVGYVYECGTTNPIDGVLVTGTNLVTTTTLTATTGGGVGVYILEFDVSNNPDGSTVHITYEGTGQWTGWFAEQDVITDYSIPHPQPVPDVYLCWYYKPAGDTSPSGMPDFGPQGAFSDAAAAVANCLWWYDNNRPEYDGLVPIEDPMVLMTDLDMYLMGDYSAPNVQAAIDAYLLNYLGTSTGILYTTLYSPPDYLDDIEEEILISQDVLLHLQVYSEIGEPMEALWVTAAGVNPANWILAISDPYLDNAEAGGPGRVPVAHGAHAPGDPTHNNPLYVSHDWYNVDISIHPGYFALYEYGLPGWYADIIDVITVCPYIIEDIEVNKTVWAGVDGEYQICLYDTFGDGWNGGTVDVYVNGGLLYAGLTLASGSGPECYPIPVVSGDVITTDYTPGSWSYENYYEILDCGGAYVNSAYGDDIDPDLTVNVPAGSWVEYTEIYFGCEATFNITVCNTGNSPIEDVNIYDTIPAGLEYVPGSATITPTFQSPNYLEWEYGWTLDASECIYIEFDVIATDCCSDLINEALVTAFGPVGYIDFLLTDTATIHPLPITNMEVTKEIWDPDAGIWTDFAEIRLGENAQFRISIYNDDTTNPCCSIDVLVDDYVAYGGPLLEYVPGTVTVNGIPATPDIEFLDEFIFNLGSLASIPPGGTMEIIFEALAVAEGNFTNAVYVEYQCTCGQESASGYAYAYADGFIYFDVTPPTVTKTLIGPVCDSNGPITNPVVGRDWTLLATYNLPGSSPETWHNDVIDLSAYDGHQIQLAFRYLSDDEWAAYFDDILVWDGSTTAHFEDFDAYADGYDFDGTAACGFYTQENYGTACGSTYHYAEVENYKSHSSPNSAEIYYNCPNDDWLVTPEIDLTGLSGAELDFWYLWDDSWDILFEVLVNDLGGGGQTIEDYWITSDTEICFDVTDDNSGAESLTIDIFYDMNNDGVINYTITDELQDTLFITDNVGGVGDPRDTNPAEGEITYCMTLPEECFHVILYYATDYEGNYPMNETTLEPIPAIEVDLVDNTPPIVEKTFSGPGTLDYLFLNEETIITLNATDLPEPPETEETFRGDTFYAYCAYGTYSYYTTWFDSDTPGTINPIAYDAYTYSFMAGGTWIDDTWWGSEYGGYGATYNRIWTIDETTGDMTLVGNTGLGTTTLNGLAYDDNTGTLYGCSSTGLYTVDMTTGVASYVGGWGTGGPSSSDIMIDMACDNDGNLYGIECGNSYDNALYSINPSTGAASLIGYTGLDLYYAQGAEYDKNNDILYLAAYTYYMGERGQPDELAPEIDPVRTGWFYICDTNTGATTLVGSFQGGSEMTALAIPYTGGGGGGGGATGEIISPGCASGIVLVEYRVWYDGVWGNWTTYWNTSGGGTGPFSLEEGCTHYLQFRAVDCLGNTLLCEDDIETPPYERGHIADVKMDPSDGIPLPASDIGSEEGSVAPDRDVDAWLRYDNDINDNSLGLTAGGVMEWAIRLTPTELAGYDGWNLTTVQFHYGWSASSIPPHDVLITVYGPGTASAPGSVITTELFYAPSVGWYDIPLTTPIVIDETQDIWISCTCDHLAGEYPAGMNSAVGVTGKSSWLNLGGWADYSSYLWCFNIAAGIEEGGVTPPPPPPPEPKNITVYNQTHYLDLEPPMSWIELELDHDGNMITPYTEFMIWQEDFACNQTYGSQCCFIHFRVDGPPGSMFYWNGQYIAADGSWHTGAMGFDTPVAFQIRDSTGYIKAGKYVVEFYAEDCLGNVESTIHRQTYYPDTTAPTTTLLFSGPYYEDQDEWITEDTQIRFETNDGETGAKVTKYQIDSGPIRTYTGPFTIPTEGKHTILYYSIDHVNNHGKEKIKTVIVDSTAPQANLIFDGDTYDDETTTWITSDTNLQLPATDIGCGLKAIYYRIDNGEWTEFTDSFTLTTGTLIEFYAEDNLGNTPPIQQLTIGVDNEAPSITSIAPQENHLYIAGREILALRTESIIVGSLRVEATATDASGVDKIEFYVDGTLRYTELGNSLQWLWDEKSLFTHTLTIKAYDNLGRVATKETNVRIFNF